MMNDNPLQEMRISKNKISADLMGDIVRLQTRIEELKARIEFIHKLTVTS
jgi:hypothetical protein